MSKSDPTTHDIERLREASAWIQRLNESTAQAVVDEWLEWCQSDSLNLPVFERMQTTWNALSRAQTAVPHVRVAADSRRHRHRSRLFALTASILVLVGVAGWLAMRYANVQVLDTAIGEQRRFTLADGSRLDLAPDSRVSTRFTLAERDVRLERGQAFFVVAHSAVRPFIVNANSLKVTALGTAFDVRIDPSSTAVTVSEGRVDVAPGMHQAGAGQRPDHGDVLASVGQRVTLSNADRRLSVAAVDPTVAGSWRDGRLRFEGEPLENVVGVVNRYGATHILVAPAFQQTRFTGTVSPKHVRDWLKALEQIYAVDVVEEGANGVSIKSRVGNGTS